ncbi:Ig-like domain-containing protein [Bifidobacterium vansinderenii]|uniref:Alpha-amylase n=1 Tax=Bifidobacterium vansinderenii TaxID=1984871 RepID=A0A229W0W1_9BIFI|nr:Ig-like domain-containing protein [Bifidobacterium vansinderenii]OXN01481.1 alpha-amylase [Bifidobacterium vansinderenii]
MGESRVVEVLVLPEGASQKYTASISDTSVAVLGEPDQSPEPEPKPVTGITLDRSTASGVTGSQLTLKASVQPADADDPTVTWSSSAPAVASVAAGVVRLLTVGRATITARAGAYSASCTVTVTAATVAVQSVTVSSPGGVSTLDVGSTLQLSASVLPSDATDRTVVWSSSATTVATVSTSGLVKGLTAGSVTVTATAGGKSGSITLTVKASTPTVKTNLLTTPPSLPLTTNGVTMTSLGDGVYHLKGTATAWTGFAFTSKQMSAGTYSIADSGNLLTTKGLGFWVRPDELDGRHGTITHEYTSAWWQNAQISVDAGTTVDLDVHPWLTLEATEGKTT